MEERYNLDALLAVIEGSDGTKRENDELESLLGQLSPEQQAEIRRSMETLAALRRQKRKQTVDAIVTSAAALGENGWLEILEYLNVHTLTRVD